MYTNRKKDKVMLSDGDFNRIYPPAMQELSVRHWTPAAVCREAAGFLAAEKNVRVLDIGSGIGKFCLAAAYYKPEAFYFGIEQRNNLVWYAELAKSQLRLNNVHFLHGNFTQLDFADYDHFYFYNSFYENLENTEKIDECIAYSQELYSYYNRYLYRQLDKRPSGTRLATFHSLEHEIPDSYHLAGTSMQNLLKFWIKE